MLEHPSRASEGASLLGIGLLSRWRCQDAVSICGVITNQDVLAYSYQLPIQFWILNEDIFRRHKGNGEEGEQCSVAKVPDVFAIT